jgi:cell division protease FtsH
MSTQGCGVSAHGSITQLNRDTMPPFIIAARRALLLNPLLRFITILALLAAVGSFIPWGGRGVLTTVAILLCCYLALWAFRAALFADVHIRSLVGPCFDLHVHTKVYPTYKWVDLYRAADARGAEAAESYRIPGPMNLHQMLRVRLTSRADMSDLRLDPPMTLARPSSATDELLLPIESCWCFPAAPSSGGCPVIIRISYQGQMDKTVVEVAAHTSDAAKEVMTELTEWASAHSIYRNKTLRIVFESGPSHRFGGQDSDHGLHLNFLPERQIEDSAIVLDEQTRAILEHTIVDFHRRRDQLMELGLPGKRGVIFYGPPGTGKTYTSAYVAQRLHDATKIIAAGKSLLRMADVCAIATSLQPALVVLEDVDLVFSDREMAPNTTLLGEFLDQLDGFASNDRIIFILTTNVLDRVEAAIKDRPGRVSQCIYFGPPNAELRQRYLEAQTQRFDISQVRMDIVAAQTDGTSQAFLKELVLRAVQFASGRNGHSESAQLALRTADFEMALKEMMAAGGKLGRRIIGFQID